MNADLITTQYYIINVDEKYNKKFIYYPQLSYINSLVDYIIDNIYLSDICDNEKYENIDKFNAIFINKEKAQAYCDWLNNKGV